MKIQRGICIPSPGSIWRAIGQCLGPLLCLLYTADLTYCGRQHSRHLCGRHCRPNYTRRSDDSNTQTTNTFKQNPIMVEKMAYEGKRNEISPSYFYPKKENAPPPVHLNNWPKPKTQSAWAYIWTGNSPGVNTYFQRENNWTSNSVNCTGSLAENRSYHWIASYSYTKQSWNLSGPMAYNCGDQHQTLLWKSWKESSRKCYVYYGRTMACADCGEKCVTTLSPTAKGLTIIPTAWQNLYFKTKLQS